MARFDRYVPPSVIVESLPVAPLVTVGVSPVVIGIVGPSLGYRTFTEAVVLTGTADTRLSKLGINPASVVVASVADVPFTVTTDYVLTAGAGDDAELLTLTDNTLDLKRAVGSTIVDGATVYVSYQYTDAAYYEPSTFTNLSEIFNFYGNPYNPQTGEITSPLSLAAQIAMRNGAREVLLLSTTGTNDATTDAELTEAYDKLVTVLDLDVVVPLTVGLTGDAEDAGDVLTAAVSLKTHLEALAADEDLKRIGVFGYDAPIDPSVIAAGTASRHVVTAYPNKMSLYMQPLGQSVEVPGYYLAAAYAGIGANYPIQMPWTNKKVYGFNGIPAAVLQTMTKQAKNGWSEAGVAVTEFTKNGQLVIRHGVTTLGDTIYNREINLVRSEWALDQILTESLQASGLIGTYITPETALQVKLVVVGALARATDYGVVVAWENCKARVTSVDPSVIEVTFAYLPPFPLNYIVVSYMVNTQTGDVAREAA